MVSDNGEEVLQDPNNASPYSDSQTPGQQEPYDDNDDTLIGIVNLTSRPIYRIQLSSSSQTIFGFEGDGICSYSTGANGGSGVGGSVGGPGEPPLGYTGDSYCTADQKNGADPGQSEGIDPNGSDYQGPMNTFENISADQQTGDVVFNNGLAPTHSTYFSLEDQLDSTQIGIQFGYWEVAADGGIFAYDAPFYGSMGGQPLNAPIVGMAADPSSGGYWEVASDGGLFSFNAHFYGSMGGQPLNAPIVGMVSTADGQGYWEVASDGGLFSFGDAPFYGSMGGQPLNSPIVGIADSPDGKGYYEVASDGGIFAFGDAVFRGSMGGMPLNQPVVGAASNQGTGGYWEVGSDGGLFSFGGQFYGSMGGKPLNLPVVALASTPDGLGYYEVASDGGIFTFGDAFFWGSSGVANLNAPVVGMATSQ